MSREIKFRAWDKNRNHMIKVQEIDLYKEKITGWNLPNGEYRFGMLQFSSSIFMQFTGLKDKNGKEIYEGDIVKAQVNDHIWYYVVETCKDFGNTLYYITRYRNFKNNEEGDQIKGDFYVNEGRGEMIRDNWHEVIGNIYENPELLEKTKQPNKDR